MIRKGARLPSIAEIEREKQVRAIHPTYASGFQAEAGSRASDPVRDRGPGEQMQVDWAVIRRGSDG